MVGLQGTIDDALQIYGDETSTVRDLQKLLAVTCGVPTADQKLCIGATLCRPRQYLDECLAKGRKTTVTLIKLDPKLRRCQGCGARGLFGAAAKLRRCSGCLDTFFCDRMCQSNAWPQHKRHCHRGAGDVPPETVPDALIPVLGEVLNGVEIQDRGSLHKHEVAARYMAKYCAK